MEQTTVNTTSTTIGGGFLITTSTAEETFIPEEFTEEQKAIAATCSEFIDKEVLPHLVAIDDQEEGLMVSLLDKAGELGLLGASLPQEYGGLGEDFVTATIINEYLGGGHSFAVAMAAHTGIGSLPILYFGTEEQKQQYIPRLASGEIIGAYALTEPGSGSDALGAKTTAKLTEDGKHYILNGQKIWITNAGFADVFTVFAKIDGEKFTGFIVDAKTPGLTTGTEEHKMGIKGSSTRQLFFENCAIPVENVLGEIGRGHIIAFNILNIGRLKLCAAAVGASKKALDMTIGYAKNREQFKTPIAKFGAIQHKVAECAIKIFASESALFRTAAWIDSKERELAKEGKHANETLLGAAEEFAIECAMLKVSGSETLNYVVDEGVQVHGGNGFMEEYNISRAYRDSRINRIFEGTNEINRLLIMDMYLKRALKGRINLLGAASAIQKELTSIPDYSSNSAPFSTEAGYIENFKKAILLCAGAAAQTLMTKLESEQELLMNIADMAIDMFQAESVLLRAMKLKSMGHPLAELAKEIVGIFISDAADRIAHNGKDAINSFAEGDEQRMMHTGLKRYTKTAAYDTKTARRNIAERLYEKGGYVF